LTDLQYNKIELIGRGDIKRFFDRLVAAREEFASAAGDPRKQAQIGIPLGQEFKRGLFTDDTLLSKTVAATLDATQLAKYHQFVSEQRRDRYRSLVELAVEMFCLQAPLFDNQRQQLIQLILDETPPPVGPVTHSHTHMFAYMYVSYQMST